MNPININTEINGLTQNIQAQLRTLDQDIPVQVNPLTQDIEINFGTGIIYAFSPIAKIQLLLNGFYRITITDKNGTTTADIPVLSKENLNNLITQYFAQNPVIEQYVQEHDIFDLAHAEIMALIQSAIDSIPTQISQLQNDLRYIKNFKQLLREYETYYSFPNIPNEEDRNMIFLDKSTGDMYVFGLNNSLTYSSIGISNQDFIYGGSSNLG